MGLLGDLLAALSARYHDFPVLGRRVLDVQALQVLRTRDRAVVPAEPASFRATVRPQRLWHRSD